MTRGFRPGPEGGAVIRLDARERMVLRQLLVELQVRLGSRGGAAGGGAPAAADPLEALLRTVESGAAGQAAAPPGDPVLARLLPDAYAPEVDQGAAAAEFRRLTEADLRAAKSEAAQAVLDSLAEERNGKIVLTAELAAAWLAALNDLRLSLGVVLEVTEDDSPRRRDPADPLYPQAAAYEWLTWLQAALVDVVAR